MASHFFPVDCRGAYLPPIVTLIGRDLVSITVTRLCLCYLAWRWDGHVFVDDHGLVATAADGLLRLFEHELGVGLHVGVALLQLLFIISHCFFEVALDVLE